MKIEMIPIEAIKEYERNPRANDAAVGPVAESIKSFGFKVPVIVDADNVIVAGHTRVRAARQLGMTEVPAVRADDLTAEQIKAFRIADNKLHELSSWNLELLTTELGELKLLDVDLNSLGFNDDELAKLFGDDVTEGLCDPDDIPEPPDDAITQPGDLWILRSESGIEHRLLCGDSSLASDVDLLISVDPAKAIASPAGANVKFELLPIHLCNTDPPYNVKVEPRSNNAIAAGLSSFGEHGLMHHQSFDRHRAEKKRNARKREAVGGSKATDGAKRTASKYHGEVSRRSNVKSQRSGSSTLDLEPSTIGQSGKATHKKMRPKDRPLANDFVSDEEFDKLLHGSFGNGKRYTATQAHGEVRTSYASFTSMNFLWATSANSGPRWACLSG
jgi:hypothetical protein